MLTSIHEFGGSVKVTLETRGDQKFEIAFSDDAALRAFCGAIVFYAENRRGLGYRKTFVLDVDAYLALPAPPPKVDAPAASDVRVD